MADVIEETAEQKLKRHEDVLVACMAEITKLREENARLRAEKSDALSVCKEVYSDPKADPALRLRAAGLALPHEVPRLESVPPPLELVAEVIEPLASVVERQRTRAARMQALMVAEREAGRGRFTLGAGRDGGNGSDDDTAG
jgi:hypothetical protein